jgi:hypothetical protein
MAYRNNNLYSNPRSQQGEISHQATVVIQCTHDKRDVTDRMLVHANKDSDDYLIYGDATLDLATCRIDRGDLVFQIGTSAVPRGNILNGAPPVTSYLNGMYWRKPGGVSPNTKGMSPEEVKKFTEQYTANKISESIRFMGVSLGATVPNPDDEADEKTQITVRTQGTMAIHHNGPSVLHPGDTLLWRVPLQSQVAYAVKKGNVARFGRSCHKQTLMTVPMRKEHDTIDVAFKKAMLVGNANNVKEEILKDRLFELDNLAAKLSHIVAAAMAVGSGVSPADAVESTNAESANYYDTAHKTIHAVMQVPAFANAINDLSGAFVKVLLDLERRKIGKVLSYAKPGEKVDVLLGSG